MARPEGEFGRLDRRMSRRGAVVGLAATLVGAAIIIGTAGLAGDLGGGYLVIDGVRTLVSPSHRRQIGHKYSLLFNSNSQPARRWEELRIANIEATRQINRIPTVSSRRSPISG